MFGKRRGYYGDKTTQYFHRHFPEFLFFSTSANKEAIMPIRNIDKARKSFSCKRFQGFQGSDAYPSDSLITDVIVQKNFVHYVDF